MNFKKIADTSFKIMPENEIRAMQSRKIDIC